MNPTLRSRLLKPTLVFTSTLTLSVAGTKPACADFFNFGVDTSVHLYLEIDGDSGTNPAIDVFRGGAGLFNPSLLSISESGPEGAHAEGSIDHQSAVAFAPSSLSASLTDTGQGNSVAIETRGTLSVYSLYQVGFSSDTPFAFTLSGDFAHSSGSPGNDLTLTPEDYGVRFRDATTGDLHAFFNLTNPTGSTTLTLPAGSYTIDSLSGMGFDAVFGSPPAPAYSSTFRSQWSFSAAPTAFSGAAPEPTSVLFFLLGAPVLRKACLRRRK